MCVDSTRFEDVKWYTTAQSYAASDKDSFATKSIYFLYIGEIIASSTFSADIDSTKITFRGEFRLISEKNAPIRIVSKTGVFGSTTTELSC